MEKKINNERKAEMIHDACRRLDLDGHITWIGYKKDAVKLPEKIAVSWNSLPLPVKNSLMYCEALDMCFFYTDNNIATVAYSGYATLRRDLGNEDKLISAFQKAKEILKFMQELMDAEMEKKDANSEK